MSWFTASANEIAAEQEHYLMFLAADFDFPSGHQRFWTGMGNLIINGQTFVGAGDLAKVSFPSERANLVAERKTFQLCGVDPALVSEPDIDGSFGRNVIEYMGFLDPETRVMLDMPEVNWEGEISSVRRVDGSEPVIEVDAEHRIVLLDQPDGWRYTDEHQQQFYPGAGDAGFTRMAHMDVLEILWGGRRVIPGLVPRPSQPRMNRQ